MENKTITVNPQHNIKVVFHYNDISTVVVHDEKKPYTSVSVDMKDGRKFDYFMQTAKSFLKQYNAIKEKEQD